MTSQLQSTTDSPSVPRKHLKHNYNLIEYMQYSLLAFLFAGLILSSLGQLIRRIPLFTTGMRKEVETFFPNNDYLWKPVHHHSNIQIYEALKHKSTHPVYHFEYQTEVPLEAFLDVLDHPAQSMEWLAWIKDYKFLGVHKNDLSNLDILSSKVYTQMVVHPLAHFHDREFMIEISSNVLTEKREEDGGETTTVTFTYTNVLSTNEIKNAFTKSCKDCIRGALDMTLTLTTDDDGATTLVSMDLDMDMNSSRNKLMKMPNFVMDSMIMRWGEVSMHKLFKRCRNNIGLKNVVNVKGSILNLIPIKR